jgi:hypothetical protein
MIVIHGFCRKSNWRYPRKAPGDNSLYLLRTEYRSWAKVTFFSLPDICYRFVCFGKEKNVEIYTHLSNFSVQNITSPFDTLPEGKEL